MFDLAKIFSKVSTIVILYSKSSSAPTFENFYALVWQTFPKVTTPELMYAVGFWVTENRWIETVAIGFVYALRYTSRETLTTLKNIN